MSEKLLDIRGLKTYLYTPMGVVKAVDGINLSIARKEVVGLVGESGCGKTMTALSILRLLPLVGKILDGQVILKGKNLVELSEREMRKVRGKDISIVFQDPMTYLNPLMRVQDQIVESILCHRNIKTTEARKMAVETLRMMRMPSPSQLARYYPHELSGGMKQRVMTAIAISCRPSLLIADEPTTSLDVTLQTQVLDLLKELVEELKMPILLITHDLGIIADICDSVYIMYAGKIIEHADVFDLYDDPKHPYTKALLESVLSINEFKKELVSIPGTVPNMINPPPGCRFHPRCPQTKARCYKEEPPIEQIEKSHEVACWLCE